MVEETPIVDLWDSYILSRRTKSKVKSEAKEKDLRSIIELDHLERGNFGLSDWRRGSAKVYGNLI